MFVASLFADKTRDGVGKRGVEVLCTLVVLVFSEVF